MKDTHPQVKFDVFERLNTGAVKLSAQELRHGLYHGKFIIWVDKAAKDNKWRELIGARSDKRMKSEEFILRFLALHSDLDTYEKPLSVFLNKFSEKNRDASVELLAEFSTQLTGAREAVTAIFGDLAFKVFDPRNANRVISQFNAAMFDAEMLAVSRTHLDAARLTREQRKRILSEASELFYNEQFQKAITLATSDVAQIKTRVKLLQDVIIRHQ
jgi:hypothetical protein